MWAALLGSGAGTESQGLTLSSTEPWAEAKMTQQVRSREVEEEMLRAEAQGIVRT